jgi:phage baseplate assembly protein W
MGSQRCILLNNSIYKARGQNMTFVDDKNINNEKEKEDSDRMKELLEVDVRLVETMFGADLSVNDDGDVSSVVGEINLAQAVLHRLRTIKGELFDTGHLSYGSTLYDFIGEPNNELTREMIKLAVRNALLEESRIKEIVNVKVTSRSLSTEKQYASSYKPSRSKETITASEMVEEEIAVTDPRMALSTVDIELSVLPIGSSTPINISFPFRLEVA